MKYSWFLTIGLFGLALSTAPRAQTLLGNPDAGYALAKKTCAKCHRIGKAEETPKLYPATAFQAIADNPAATELSLRVFLRTPHRDMPNLVLRALGGTMEYLQKRMKKKQAPLTVSP